MRYLLFCLLLVSLLKPLCGASEAVRSAFPAPPPGLERDPSLRVGELANGFRYVLRNQGSPKGRCSLRLVVLAGALQETEPQRGLAHFLEHLAFNGGRNFPPDTLVAFLQRMGMSMGGDANASTSNEATVYKLELPDSSQASIQEGLRFLTDVADGLLLDPEQIERERGVVASERRARDSVQTRLSMARQAFYLEGTLAARRRPIGDEKVILSAGREQFVDYYDTWYRPERMALVCVGGFDSAELAKALLAQFGAIHARRPSRAPAPLGVPSFSGATRAHFHHEAELSQATVEISCLAPVESFADGIAAEQSRLRRSLALALLGRRFDRFRMRKDAAFSDSRVLSNEWYRTFRQQTLSLNCSSAGWREALGFAEQELRRATSEGFSAQELSSAIASLLGRLSQSANSAANLAPRALSEQYASALVQGGSLCSPKRRFEIAKTHFQGLSPEDLRRELAGLFPDTGRHIFVSAETLPEGDPQAAILEAYAAATGLPVGPLPETVAGGWEYRSFGAAGKVVRRQSLSSPRIEVVEFENGVRLNFMPIKSTSNKVELLARVGEGVASAPVDMPGLPWLAERSLLAGGLGRHASEEYPSLFAGRSVDLRFSLGFSAFEFRGSTNVRDLRLELQYLTAQLSDPGWREEGTRLARARIAPLYAGMAHSPTGPLGLQLARLVAGGDLRFGFPAREDLEARTDEELRGWLGEELGEGPLELGVIGNMEVDQVVLLVGETLGALPERRKARLPREAFSVRFPATPFASHHTVSSSVPKALVLVYWPTDDGIDLRRGLMLRMLGAAVRNRLRIKIRQQMGETYSPGVRSTASQSIPGYGYLQAGIDVAPGMVEQVTEAVLQVGEDLAREGISPAEFEELRQPALTGLKDSLRSTSQLLSSLLAQAQSEPARLAWHRDCVGFLTKLRAEELSALAARYLPRARASRASIVSDGKGPAPVPVPSEGEKPEEAVVL